MLKLFANQRKITAMLSRACLPAVASSSLRNTHNLKDCRRSMSDDCPSMPTEYAAGHLPSTGHFHVWSLISQQRDSFLTIDMEGHDRPSLKCTGTYEDTASLVDMIDSTEFPTPSVSFRLTLNRTKFYLSLDNDKDVVARPLENGKPQPKDEERFIHLIHGSYSMFESKRHRDKFLGSYKDGSLHLIDVHDKRHPDPRVLFLMHSKLNKS